MAPLPVGQGSKEPARGGVLGVSSATSFFLEFPLTELSHGVNQYRDPGKAIISQSIYDFLIGDPNIILFCIDLLGFHLIRTVDQKDFLFV